MQYRRIIEVFESDEDSPSVLSRATESSSANPKDQPFRPGPETLAEADPADEDIAEFKRIQIVAPAKVTEPVESAEVDEFATILSISRLTATSSHSLANLSYKIASGIPSFDTITPTEASESYASNRRRRRADRTRMRQQKQQYDEANRT
ncbi:hypothetical protein N7488_007169 [Penicillium malachiteum]|nr:hypothetical protein N7488_007169 [Penicillium malachiteum]